MEIRKLSGISVEHTPYSAGLAQLEELGEEAVTPAILSALGTLLATAPPQQAQAICKILVGMGAAVADSFPRTALTAEADTALQREHPFRRKAGSVHTILVPTTS